MLTRRRFIASSVPGTLLVFAPNHATAATQVQAQDPWQEVGAFHAARCRDAGIAGSSLAYMRRGEPAMWHTVGYQDTATRRPVDRDTIYHWASITKTMTGVAIMQLRDRGMLALDDPIARYVPELRRIHNPHGSIDEVRIRHLMSHSGGFRAGTWPFGGDQPWHPFEPTEWTQLVAMMPYTQVLFAPGTRYSYSNPGVVYLGRAIERLTGDDYEVYVTKNILMPLAMHRSFFDRAPYHLLGHRSHSYSRTDEGVREHPFDFDTGITVSNGGLNAPLDDMLRYLAFLIGDPRRAPAFDGVLKRTSLEEMFTPQVEAVDGEGGSGTDVAAGLSCFIERHHGVELVGHSGDQNGFISHLYLHRGSHAGYVVSFNTSTTSAASPARTTRAADNELRDLIIRTMFARSG